MYTRNHPSCLLLLTLAALFGPAAISRAEDAPTYWKDIRPVLRKNCAFCHAERHISKLDVSGGLALDSYAAILKGSQHPVLKKGDSANSLMVQLMLTSNAAQRMPLDGDPLPKATIALIRRWIDSGAPEGQKPAEEAEPERTRTPVVRRKRDITLTTTATPPAGLLGKTPPAPLAFRLKVGPLVPVTAVAFSPDGKYLAAGSYGLVTIWDLNKMQPVQTITSVLGAVNDLCFSPDGKLLACGGGQPSARGELRLYKVADWKTVAAFREHTDVVFSLSFSPDGKKLASASFDQTIRLWDIATLKPEQTLKGHSDFVYAVAFGPKGERFASVSKDRTLQITDAKTGKGIFTLGGMQEDVMAVAYHPSGKQVVSSGFESSIYWWDAATGEKIKQQGGHGVAVQELCFSKDGAWLVSAGADRTVRLWNGTNGAPISTITVGSPVYAVAISADKKWIASGSFDGLVRLWDAKTGKQLLTLLSLPPEDNQELWLAQNAAGYSTASARVKDMGRWSMRGQDVAAAPVWQALQQPEVLVQALQGKPLPAPKFGK